MNNLTLKIKNVQETKLLAKYLSEYFVNEQGVIFLDGDLGAGKTTFTQFFANYLGITDIVTSPTFNIFKRYETTTSYLNHFDLYRIRDAVYDQGFEEYWFANEISIIEWSVYLPDEFKDIAILKMYFNRIDDEAREIQIYANEDLTLYLKEKCYEFIY